ncbi:TonB-dependent receptor plug domain-containing protein [Polluticaenibacter yanchengensis]|uniref:TonB-dependent receptor plug domain-containing protein n=1 Tax=Polluticaenibacter yanchengensis TaxID=3014562 RepID=UPI00387AA507
MLIACFIFVKQNTTIAQSSADSLQSVEIISKKYINNFSSTVPVQTMNANVIKLLNAPSVADISKFLTGVVIKDYGGLGGLKTVSVRSLGASHTGVLYDGVNITDMQNSQIDLGKYADNLIHHLALYQSVPVSANLPAQAYSSSALLMIETPAAGLPLHRLKIKAGTQWGSWGLNRHHLALQAPWGSRTQFSIAANYQNTKGNYPFKSVNGNVTEHLRRENSQVNAAQVELNLSHLFKDSGQLQVKVFAQNSDRGLPKAVIYYYNLSNENLWNNDVFTQVNYKRKFNHTTSFSTAIKYSNHYTRYTNPTLIIDNKATDNKYTEQSVYYTAALLSKINKYWALSVASDIAVTDLNANLRSFAYPTRFSNWSVAGVQYNKRLLDINMAALYTYMKDEVESGIPAARQSRLTPNVSLAYKFHAASPFLIRAFYKTIFRNPNFNDLYYTIIGNRALRPELAKQLNLGVAYQQDVKNTWLQKIGWSMDAYYNKVTDKILAMPGGNLFAWSMLNIGKVNIWGADISVEGNGKIGAQLDWRIKTGFNYNISEDRSNKNSVNYKTQIPNTPKTNGFAIAMLNYKQIGLVYNALYSGTRYSLGGNLPENKMDSYVIHDVSLNYGHHIKKWQLQWQFSVNNLLDKAYDIVMFYPMPGRNIAAKLVIQNFK